MDDNYLEKLVSFQKEYQISDDNMKNIITDWLSPKPDRPHTWIPVGLEGGDGGGYLSYTKYDISDWIRRDITNEEWSKFYDFLKSGVDNIYGEGCLKKSSRSSMINPETHQIVPMEHGVIEILWEEAFQNENRAYWVEFRDHFWNQVARLIT